MRTLLSSPKICVKVNISVFSLPVPQFLDCCSSRLGHCTSQQVSSPPLPFLVHLNGQWRTLYQSFSLPTGCETPKSSTDMTNKRMPKLLEFPSNRTSNRSYLNSALPSCWKSPKETTVPLTYNPHDGLVGILSVYKCKSKGSENFHHAQCHLLTKW